MSSLSRRQGFTLLELMIALAIIAIISAVAVPSFLGSVRKGRRSDASDAAAAVMQAQERWRANNASYTASFAALGLAPTSGNGYYTMALSNVSGTGYRLAITPVAGKGQTHDSGCTALDVYIGVTTAGTPAPGVISYTPEKCWGR